jgi:hypothetical protein
MAWIDIYDRKSTYGFAPGTWQAAKDLVQHRIVSNLCNPRILLTTYGDLVSESRHIIDFGTPPALSIRYRVRFSLGMGAWIGLFALASPLVSQCSDAVIS